MDVEYCPREDTVREFHATEDQLPNLSLDQTNGEGFGLAERSG